MKQLSILIYSNENLPFIREQVGLLEHQGHQVELYTFKGAKNPFIYLKEIIKLMRKDVNEYDLIHAYFGFAGFTAIMQGKIPVITTYCGSDLLGVVKADGKYDLYFTTISRLSSIIASIFSVKTTTLSSHLERKLFFKKKNKVIKLGVDINHFIPMEILSVRKELNWDFNDIYILFPADSKRVVKRYKIAEEIINSIQKRQYRIHLVSLDRPNMYPIIPKLMNACNAMILVSRHEGSPNVIRESMACNLPIFSFDVGDVREQTFNASPGYIAEMDDKNSLINALEEFLKTTPFARSNGREIVINQTWEKYIIEMEKIYYSSLELKGNYKL